MLFTIFSVFYVLIAAAMIVLILMQRGDGANAGASFGGGASGTVFGARGSASFLTRTTGVLAGLFFILSLGMGIYLSHHGVAPTPKQELGVMAGVGSSAPVKSAAPASAPATAVPAGNAVPSSAPVQHSEVPVAPSAPAAAKSEVPASPTASGAAKSEVPAAPAKASAPAASVPASSAPPASH